jgi:peptide chain release factor subunit 1
MHSERFRHLVETPGPFVTLCFDDSHDTADAATQLDSRLRDIRKHLEEQSVAPAVIEALAAAVRGKHPPTGRSGRVVIAADTAATPRIVLDEHLGQPPAVTTVRVSDLPYIVPVLEHGTAHISYLVVTVDHTGADIDVHGDGRGAETVTGGAGPVHKARGAETAGYGGPQGRVEEAVRRNIREVADRVTHLTDAGGFDVVFVAGEVTARSELIAELPERVAARSVALHGGGRTAGTDDAEVHREIAEEFTRRRTAILDDAAGRFAAGRGTGLALEGLAPVTAALRDGAVDTLIIGDLGGATVVAGSELTMIAPTPETLSALGCAPERVLRADEALPLLAVATNAVLVRADDRMRPADGLAAVLRYPDAAAG